MYPAIVHLWWKETWIFWHKNIFFSSCPDCQAITNLTEMKQALRGRATMYSCSGCVLYNCEWISWTLCNWQSCQEVMDFSLCWFVSMGGLDGRLQGSKNKKIHYAVISKVVPFCTFTAFRWGHFWWESRNKKRIGGLKWKMLGKDVVHLHVRDGRVAPCWFILGYTWKSGVSHASAFDLCAHWVKVSPEHQRLWFGIMEGFISTQLRTLG